MPRTDPSPRYRRGLDGFGTGWTRAAGSLQGRVCVLAPHLDDGPLSVGAAIAAAARAGADVRVISIFAGDPDSSSEASWWDERGGFRTEGAAAAGRREEDTAACRVLGATPVWLAFADEAYEETVSDETIWNSLAPHLQGARLVLAPGFPLMHRDHVRVCRLARARVSSDVLGFYVEQPYAAWLRSGRSPRIPDEEEIARLAGSWRRVRSGAADWAAKVRAGRAYTSQLPLLKNPLSHVLRYELARGGETIALPS